MQWDRFFEDLEDQLDSEWEAERAVLDTEAERLRLSRVGLRERLVALSGQDDAAVSVDLVAGPSIVGRVAGLGADWVVVDTDARRGGAVVVPLTAIAALSLSSAAVVRSARDATAGPSLAQRMGFGFVLRDLARRRVPVTVHTSTGRELSGTIDRAGVDHLDLALHDAGGVRRASEVHGFRLIPFHAVACVRLDEPVPLP